MSGKGLRFNEGKTRKDLLPNFAITEMSKVLTAGSLKYADRNWEKGMEWSKCLASLRRHIDKFESGIDFDEETGLLHMAHAMTNCSFILEYYNIYPQGDDRQHKYLKIPRIGLDVDDVIADFIPAFQEKFGLKTPKNWNWSYKTESFFDELAKDEKLLEEFYLSIPAKINPSEIPFEPCCYVTSRNVPQWITEKWIEDNGFPCVPIVTVGHNISKVDALLKNNVDVFIDDRFENFTEINNAGISCFLFDGSHNQRYDVGHKRIKSLKELPWFKI